ncbi:IncA family protein [Chlamydia abortus]|uniref:IncA family protein n=1 Tax=Chlamydia abortus TaxID=83555 RepID=UPI0032EB980F
MTTSPVNTNPIATHISTTQHTLSNTSVSKYQRIATAIALLAGMVLVGTLIGALVFFALPTSVTLVALVSVALLASVILLSMAMYNLVSQSRRVSSDPQLGEENTRLEAEMIRLREQLIRFEAQLAEEQGRCSELSVKLMGAIGDLAQANQEKASLESKVQALKELVASYPAIAEEAEKMQAELKKRIAEVASAKQDVGRLEEQVRMLETQLTHSLEQVDTLSKQKEELELCLKQLQDEGVRTVVKLQGKLIDLTEQIEVKDKDLESLINQNTDLATKVQSLEEELEKDQEVIEGLENRITILAYTRNELTSKVKNLHYDLESKGGVILGLEDKVQGLEEEKKKVEEDFFKAQNQIKSLEAAIAHKINIAMQETARLLCQVAKLNEQLEDSSGEIKVLKTEKSSLISGMDKLQAQLDELQAQVAASTFSSSDLTLSGTDLEGSEVLSATDDFVSDSGDTNDLED